MSPRTGRPTDNPKASRIGVRLDSQSQEILNRYCAVKGVNQAEAVRRGIYKLQEELPKQTDK